MTEATDALFATIRLNRRVYAIIFVLLIMIGSALRITGFGGVVHRTPDENTYAWESNVIADQGVQGFRSLVDQFQRDPSMFERPSPSRAGYLWILSGVVHVSGVRDARAGAILSCLSSIGSLVLLGLIAWRRLSPGIAVAAMLLYAVSPPVLAMARRSWQESFVEFVSLLLLFVALEAVKEKASKCWIVAAGVLAASSITIKEIALLDAGLVLALLAIALIRRGDWRKLGLLALSSAVSGTLCCAWLAHELGSLSILISFTRRNLAVAGTSAYALAWQSGSVSDWFTSLWICDPMIFTLGMVGLVIAIMFLLRSGNSLERHSCSWLSIVALFFVTLPVLTPHHLNVRFICPVFGPLCLLSGLAVWEIGAGLYRTLRGNECRWTTRFALAVFLCAAFINYQGFQERFVHSDLQDLSIRMIQAVDFH